MRCDSASDTLRHPLSHGADATTALLLFYIVTIARIPEVRCKNTACVSQVRFRISRACTRMEDRRRTKEIKKTKHIT
jgi:hypothetical protein